MADVSDLFKSYFQELNKAKTMGLQPNTKKMEFFNQARKAKRDTLMNFRRNIDKTDSPYITPGPKCKISKQSPKLTNSQSGGASLNKVLNSSSAEQSKRRLESLAKWKAEKEERKRIEKAKAKPIFKVSHVSHKAYPVIPGTPNCTHNSSKSIKGKSLPSTTKKSQFAPLNHLFKPPQGIKPIALHFPTTKSNKNDLKDLKDLTNKLINTFSDGMQNKKSSKPPITELNRYTQEDTVVSVKSSFTYRLRKVSAKQLTKASSQNTEKNTPAHGKISLESQENLRKLNNQRSNDRNTDNKAVPKKNSLESQRLRKLSAKPSIKETAKGILGAPVPVSHKLKKIDNQKLNNINIINKDITPQVTTRMQTRSLRRQPRDSTTDEKMLEGTISKKVVAVKQEVKDVENNSENILKHTPKESKKSCDIDINSNSDKDEFDNGNVQNADLITKLNNISLQSPKCNGHNNTSTNKTPKRLTNVDSIPVYVSPFVTISRGKQSARKEYKARNSQCIVPIETDNGLNAFTSPISGANYFTNKLNMEIARITLMCSKWQDYLSGPDVPEEAKSSIDVAVGQANLLMSKKCKQFRGLIDQCRTPLKNEKAVTCEDLHGYWDVMYIQVEDVDKRFDNLDKLKENNWIEFQPQKKMTEKKVLGRSRKVGGTSKLKSLIQAARQKKKEETEDEEKLLEGGYFKISTPVKEKSVKETNSARRSGMLLLPCNRTPSISSPGLTMMKISQSIKQGQGLTPVKSILKVDTSKSTGKKSVIFKDDVCSKPLSKVVLFGNEDKENFSENVNNLSTRIVTPRKSIRLAKI